MNMSPFWKISLVSSLTGALGALTATGCGATGSARVSSTKKATNTKSGYIDTPNGEVKVQYTIKDDFAVIGGDVLLPLNKIREKSNKTESSLGLFGAGKIWPNGRVPYIVDANFCCTAELTEAIRLWAPSGLTFVPKTQADIDYLVITNEMPNTGSCGVSYGVGRQGGPQKVTASHNPRGCGSTLATMVHELGHAVGFLHEHTRPDRDTHLFIPKEQANESQVAIVNSGTMIGGFDVNSVMMYSSLQIPGMVNRATGAPIVEIIRPSANDIQRAASIYGKSGGQQPPPPPPNSGGSGQPPPSQPSNGYSMIAPINACQTAIGVNDSFPQLGISADNIPYFSCWDRAFSAGKPIIVCQNSFDANSCFYTKKILVNGRITDEADVINQGAGQGPAPLPALRSYTAPTNACRDIYGIQDSFPRLAFDPSNEPVFVCKFGISPPYPVMACYLNGSSNPCVDTGLIANF